MAATATGNFWKLESRIVQLIIGNIPDVREAERDREKQREADRQTETDRQRETERDK